MMRVTSYNVHGFIGRDRRYDVERISAVLHEIDADIIGLQEVSATPAHPEPWVELAARLGMHAVPGPTLTRDDGPFGNALLSRWSVGNTRTVELSVAGREPRGAVIAPTGPCHTVVTHLGLRSRERLAQSLRLSVVLNDIEGPVVVLADANTSWRWSRALGPLDRMLGPSTRLATFPARWPLLPLDRVWIAGANTRRTWTHHTPLTREASDHLPICADVDLP